MNILYVLNSGTPGGMEQHVLDLVKGMVSNGNKVVVACKKGEIANWYADAGATVYKREIRFDIDLFYISFLINILKKENIDIVHAHELKAVANSLIAGLFAGTKVKVTHTHTPISEWQVSGFVDTLVKFFEVTS